MQTGQCYCGTVKCRRVSGATVYTAGFLPEANFSITAGQDAVREYHSPQMDGLARCFCGKCGGRVFIRLPIPGLLNIAMTTLDQEPTEDKGVHINVDSKAPWDTVAETLPQFSEFPPGFFEKLQALVHE